MEIMKTLHGFHDPVINKEIGSIDYMEEDKEKKLLRVLLKGENKTRYIQMVRQTIEETKTTDLDEAVIVTNKLTKNARSLVTSADSVSYISPKMWRPFTENELKYVIEKKIAQLEKQDDLSTDVREQVDSVKRNASFHASMKWNDLLMEDLSTLLSIQDRLQTEVAH